MFEISITSYPTFHIYEYLFGYICNILIYLVIYAIF